MSKNYKPLRVVSLFDGISCGRLALEKAEYSISDYYAFEIDKYAKAISRYNYPDIIQCGDVLDGDFSQFTDIDIILGGSPCTFWSIAKKDREVDKDGIGWALFMQFVKAVKIIKPKYFLYENVASMPKNIKKYISIEFDCEPILINSALVSAQQRKRLYWTNIKGVTQPNDKGILLKDILETGITARDKSLCLDACYYKGGNHSSPHKQSAKRLMVYEPVQQSQSVDIPIALTDKSQTILSTLYKENALSMLKRKKTGLFIAQKADNTEEVGAALRTRSDDNGSFKRLEVRKDGKLNALTTVTTDSIVCKPIRVGSIGSGGQGNRIYSVQGKTVSLTANGNGLEGQVCLYKIDLPDGDYTIRKLTPIEAERCQTLPDNFTAFGTDDSGKTIKISNSQRYKCVGNAWTADIIAHILEFIRNEEQPISLENGGSV